MAVHSQTAWWARQRCQDGGMEASALCRGVTLRPREAPLLGTTSPKMPIIEEPHWATGPGPQSPELKHGEFSGPSKDLLHNSFLSPGIFMPPMDSMLNRILCTITTASFHDQVGQYLCQKFPWLPALKSTGSSFTPVSPNTRAA